MPRTKRQTERARPSETCAPCQNKNDLLRALHHSRIDRKGNLAEHLREHYGEYYDASGKLKRRIEFVREFWKNYLSQPMEARDGLITAYDTAKQSLSVNTRPLISRIEKSQPEEKEIPF